MIFIRREHLCVFRTDTVLDVISKKELIKPLLERPGNVVYFETENGLYGLVSTGDVYRANGELVPINRNYSSFEKDQPMQARQFFRSHPNVGELPALEGGQLVGEFQAADDELLLDRAVPFSRNAYASAFFERMRNLALVRPADGHGYKLRYFERMKETLDTYHADYTVITLEEMMDRIKDFRRFLVVDLPEKKGAMFAFYLLRNKALPNMLLTYYDVQEMLGTDFEWVFQTLKSQGVETILLSHLRHTDSEYYNKTSAAIQRRYPKGEIKPIRDRAMPYIESFFDDLWSVDGYAESIINECFTLDTPEQMMRLKDTTGKYLNILRGERLTVGQPKDYERTVYFFGACLVIGNYVADAHTIESWLQKRFNDAGMKIRVVNCGSWGDNVSMLSRIISTKYRKGDVVVTIKEELRVQADDVTTLNLWDILEKHQTPVEWLMDNPLHVNHHVTKMYADELFSLISQKIKGTDVGDLPVAYRVDIIDRFFVKYYFYGVDLEKYKTASFCVFNANPFTKGHRYLIETAAKATEHVYLLILKDNPSIFSFGERYTMAVDSLRDLENVTVIPSGLFIGAPGRGSRLAEYFVKVANSGTAERCRERVRTDAAVASSLHATHVFRGEEPTDPVTVEINRASIEILPKYGIQPVIVPRKTHNGVIITGSLVRKLAEERDEKLREYVPAPTADVMLCESINVF